MEKSKEILNKQKKQNKLKKEVKNIKKKLPSFIIGFIFFSAISLYFLEDKFYSFFGNSVNLVIAIVILFSIICFIFLYNNFMKIKKKEKESKILGSELYKLMKLEKETKDE